MDILDTMVGIPSPTAVADFAAGLVFGLTGDNHLDEIEKCFKSTDPMRVDLLKAVDDFKHLHFISGVEDLGDIIWQLPTAFQDCTGMDDDIAAIEAWAEIFHHPITLTETISKNWLVHGTEIEADITKQNADWAAGNYYGAGQDMADALVGLLGPINPSLGGSYNPMVPADIAAGFIWQMTGGNPGSYADQAAFQTYMEGCYADSAQVDAAINQAITYFDQGGEDNIKAGVKLILAQIPAIEASFNGCSEQTANIQKILNYVTYVQTMNPDQRFTMVLKNLQANYATLKTDAKTISDDYSHGDYFGVGELSETAANLLIPMQ